MASYLGISRVRVYQLIKAGLPLTSFEEASAWRLGRKPGHPKKMVMEEPSKSHNPIPDINAARPDAAAPHTDAQILAQFPAIKSLVQSCTPSDSSWLGLSNSFCNFDSMLLQLGASMQKVFLLSLSETPGVEASKICNTTHP